MAGQHYEVEPSRWKGARDRSWGVRPVGEPEAPGIRLKDMANATVGFLHNWLPMQFDDYMVKVCVDEDYDGTPEVTRPTVLVRMPAFAEAIV